MIPSHRTSIRSGPAPWQRRVRAMMALMAFAALTALAQAHGLYLIEDACHALGAREFWRRGMRVKLRT